MQAKYENNEFSTTTLRPYHTSDGRYTCLFQGELVNQALLCTKLELSGNYLQGTRTEELLIALYRFSGRDFVEILRGKFIFIIFDHEEKELLAARDRYGTKTLYYQLTDDGITFATDISQFTHHPEMKMLNNDTLYHYFLTGYFCEEKSYLNNVLHVPAGCLVVYQQVCGLRIYPYADLLVIEGARLKSVDENQVFQVVTENIQTRIAPDKMHGIVYTGGTDELILATTVKLAGGKFKLFMADFGGKQVVDHALEPFLVRRRIFPKDYWESAVAATQLLALPLTDPRLPVDNLLIELASKHVDAVISTDGADHLFGADQSLLAWVLSLKGKRVFSKKEKAELLAFGDSTKSNLVESYLNEITDLDLISKQQTIALNTRLRENDTMKTEQLTTPYNLNAKYPFLDDDILSIASFLTTSEKQKMSLLKQTFNPQLVNFGLTLKHEKQKIPLAKWIRTDLHNNMKELFDGEVVQEYFNQEALQSMLKIHRKGFRDFSKQLWALAIFIIWLENL